MRDVAWRMGFTLMVLVVLVLLGPGISCNVDNRLLELALGQTPRAQLDRYLSAVADGDRQTALALWSPQGSPNAALEARREAVTDELLGYGPHLEYQILDTVWLRTCCEPGVITDPREAGGARLQVILRSEHRPDSIYTFDLLVPGGYWGGAAGYPVREWAIVDVYPEGAPPLAWPWR